MVQEVAALVDEVRVEAIDDDRVECVVRRLGLLLALERVQDVHERQHARSRGHCRFHCH